MKALFVTTKTNDMPNYVESFSCLGNEVEQYTFDHMAGTEPSGETLDAEIYSKAKAYSPDLLVYIGACQCKTPSPQIFARLKAEGIPTVHLCPDAESESWWPELLEFNRHDSFTVQVGMDGGAEWPLKGKGLAMLMAFDPARYPEPPKGHALRNYVFGFAGNAGGMSRLSDGRVVGRRAYTAAMQKFGLKVKPRNEVPDSYQEVADFNSECRMIPNFGETGSYDRMHVKWRVIEAGMGASMLLEPAGSPTSNWFEPNVDYLEWTSILHLEKLVKRLRNRPDETQGFGDRLRAKVQANHLPKKFWATVLGRV